MKNALLILFLFTMVLVGSMACQQESTMKSAQKELLQNKINQFAKTPITYDSTLLDARQKVVVEKLYQAAKVMDEIFLDQVYAGNRAIKAELEAKNDELSRLTLEYFTIMFGPFDRLENDNPFYGSTPKPRGANYYPEDMSSEEFLEWLKNNPQDETAFRSEFTVIRRQNDRLVAIPYSEYYKEPLIRAAWLLREAAEYADNPSLKRYLLTRADAFESNDYFESDLAWMDLNNHLIEVVIGPYEVYEDKLFNYKAAFECFLTIKDPRESEKLEIFSKYLTEIEKNLPYPDRYKNFERGLESPIMVVNLVFSGGDTKAGVQTLAFNLPNDERVREAKGSKKVLLKNVHEAKFEKQLLPIAEVVLPEDQLPQVTFDAFFNHTLMHEMSHGVGPGNITIDGRKTDVKTELKETYSMIEECKADVLGMYNNYFMIEKGVYAEEFRSTLWPSFLAGIFRSIRFGIGSAHGAGNAIILNYFLEKGAYEFDPKTEKLTVNETRIFEVVTDLAQKLLIIQATGDYKGAKALIEQYAVESEAMRVIINKLSHIPVDIRPIFQIEQ
jgi:hypothetical protein